MHLKDTDGSKVNRGIKIYHSVTRLKKVDVDLLISDNKTLGQRDKEGNFITTRDQFVKKAR